MSDPTPTPAPADKNAPVTNSSLCRLRILTYASLSLNVLILLLILGAIICHHHRHRHHGFGGAFGRGGYAEGCSMRGDFGGYGHHFHHFGGGFGPGQRWSGPGNGGFGQSPNRGGSGGVAGSGPGNFRQGFGGPGSPGFFDHGFGGKGGPPDPAKMTDAILDHLTRTLTLTDDQKAKIKPIIQQQVTQIQQQMEAQRAAMQKQFADAKVQIRPLLTADQQKQLDALPVPGQKPPDAATPPPDTTN